MGAVLAACAPGAFGATTGDLAAAQPLVPLEAVCGGDAPLWRAQIGPDTASFLHSPDARRAEIHRGAFVRLVAPSPGWVVWRGAAVKGTRSPLVLTMRMEACSVPGPDWATPPRMLEHRVIASFADGSVAAGCCRVRLAFDAAAAPVAEFAGKPPDDWARWLPDLLPAIDACLLDAGVPAVRVAWAWPMNRGKAGVRLVDQAGQPTDCVADLGRRKVERVGPPLSDVSAHADRTGPVFLPAREQPPLVDCGRLERVLDARKRLRGYLHYGPCD